MGLFADDESTLGGCGLQARRCVDDVPDCERLPTIASDGHHRIAGVHRRTRGEIEPVRAVQLLETSEHSEAGSHRPLRVVPVRYRRAEDRHDGVAGELLQRAAVLLDPPPRLGVVDAERVANVLGIRLVGSRRKADEIDEEYGDELPLFAPGTAD